MKDSLRRVMIAAPGAGRLAGVDVRTGRAEHPVCGDEVEVDFDLRDGVVQEFRWRASGCPATTAVAAAAADAWRRGVAVADLPAALQQRLAALGGLARHEHHAVALLLRAVAQAVAPDAGAPDAGAPVAEDGA